ncbi:MAG: NAD(P)-binding domain-containing protein [Bdellovibrionaceae bacterium]|nr:NAD(P)-binding domain-containing protein [Pseudobdellovibrionaceae bacterium]
MFNSEAIFLKNKKLGFIGAGNMTQHILTPLLADNILKPEQVLVSNRSAQKLQKLQDKLHITPCQSNEELLEKADIIILAIKPQDLYEALEPVLAYFEPRHEVISLAAGVSLKSLSKLFPKVNLLSRVMLSTAVKIKQAVIAYDFMKNGNFAQSADEGAFSVKALFSPLGKLLFLKGDQSFRAFTVGAGGGIALIYELMIYWQGWLKDYEITGPMAEQITQYTFLAASQMVIGDNKPMEELQQAVTSAKGVTIEALEAMRASNLEGQLHHAFEQARLKDVQLSSEFKK